MSHDILLIYILARVNGCFSFISFRIGNGFQLKTFGREEKGHRNNFRGLSLPHSPTLAAVSLLFFPLCFHSLHLLQTLLFFSFLFFFNSLSFSDSIRIIEYFPR